MQWALVGGLGEAGAAAFCALLLMGAIYLIRGIAAALPKINLGFFTIDLPKYFLAIAQPVESWLVGATNELWSDAEWWMRGIGWTFTQMFDGIRDLLVHQATLIDHVYTSVIPQAGAHALNTATAFITHEVSALRSDISAARTTVEHIASKDEAAAIAKAQSLVHSVAGDITATAAHAITTAEAYTDRQIAILAGVAGGAVDTAEGYAGAAVAGVRDYVDGAIRTAEEAANAALGAVNAQLAASIAVVGASVLALAREFDSCAVTSCAGPNNLQNLLSDILGLGELAAFAAFLDDAINHPEQVEREYADKFRSIYQTVTGAGGGIVSELEAVLSL